MKVSPSIAASDPPASTRAARPPRPPARPSRRPSKWRGFLLAVVLPTLIAAGYLYGIAADQYASDARILVRTASPPIGGSGNSSSSGSLGSLLSGGTRTASDETMAVRDFLRSQDAIRTIAPQVDLVSIWRRPEADLAARLWWSEPTGEQLHRYYGRMVAVDYDQESNAVTLLVKTFRAEDSKAIAEALLAAAERLVNTLGQRQREGTLESARAEVGRAEARVSAARDSLTRFRLAERAIDPTREVGGNMDTILRLEGALTEARAELQEKSGYMRTDNPQVAVVRNRIGALERQIALERTRVTAGEQALPQQLAGYERLLVEREFADRQLTSALAGLEYARIETERQQLWLSRVVHPQVADSARYPRASYILLSLFAVLCALYGLGALLMAGFREHAS
ncbi:capsule biosynthesis protein [Roseomonas sp. CCTCC AB2023176]|uniref:capsule biosynthesis protein n=1 Tax=Roseomonas sp. CCTCC AB2023176 TaxID=3342640 RepID=UPI0035D5455D